MILVNAERPEAPGRPPFGRAGQVAGAARSPPKGRWVREHPCWLTKASRSCRGCTPTPTPTPTISRWWFSVPGTSLRPIRPSSPASIERWGRVMSACGSSPPRSCGSLEPRNWHQSNARELVSSGALGRAGAKPEVRPATQRLGDHSSLMRITSRAIFPGKV